MTLRGDFNFVVSFQLNFFFEKMFNKFLIVLFSLSTMFAELNLSCDKKFLTEMNEPFHLLMIKKC